MQVIIHYMSLEMKLDHQISQSVKKKRFLAARSWGCAGAAYGPGIDVETLLECFLAVLDGISCKKQSRGLIPSASTSTPARKFRLSVYLAAQRDWYGMAAHSTCELASTLRVAGSH